MKHKHKHRVSVKPIVFQDCLVGEAYAAPNAEDEDAAEDADAEDAEDGDAKEQASPLPAIVGAADDGAGAEEQVLPLPVVFDSQCDDLFLVPANQLCLSTRSRDLTRTIRTKTKSRTLRSNKTRAFFLFNVVCYQANEGKDESGAEDEASDTELAGSEDTLDLDQEV